MIIVMRIIVKIGMVL